MNRISRYYWWTREYLNQKKLLWIRTSFLNVITTSFTIFTCCYECIYVFKLYVVFQHFSTVTINAKPFVMGTVFMQGQFELRRFTVKEKVNAYLRAFLFLRLHYPFIRKWNIVKRALLTIRYILSIAGVYSRNITMSFSQAGIVLQPKQGVGLYNNVKM